MQGQAVVVDHVVQFADDVIHALVVGTARQVHLHIVAVEVARKHLVAQQYAGAVLAQQAVIEPGTQEAGFGDVLFFDACIETVYFVDVFEEHIGTVDA